MNDLFTVLIILAVIISFLNKIFGQQKKKQQTTGQREPIPRKKPAEWIPPWLEIDEAEPPVLETVQPEPVDKSLREGRAEEEYVNKTEPSTVLTQDVKKKAIASKKTIGIQQAALKRLEALNIDLSSPNELRKGIVLAEILGQCKARQFLKRG